jgi:predicted RNase H-like nuclease (RuvC/YqgF family)
MTMETQATICPICIDDHQPDRICTRKNLLARIESLRAEIESLRARVNQSERIAETAERERYEAQSDFAASANENEGLKNGSRDLMLINSKMSAALDAADRLAEMVRQHAAENAGYDASSFRNMLRQAARAGVGKPGRT